MIITSKTGKTPVACYAGHRFKADPDKSTSVNKYLECKRCGSRRIEVDESGCYQPIDREWLSGQDQDKVIS